MTSRFFTISSSAALALMGACLIALSSAQVSAQERPSVRIDDNGTVHVPEQAVPVSSFLSPEGKAYLAQHLKQLQDAKATAPLPEEGGMPTFLLPYLHRMKELYLVNRQDTKIGGVPVYIYTPKDGVALGNKKRVLINLHGGGFAGCFPGCAELESIPVSATGGFKVVSVDYREGPEYHFPAASEDVAKVYSQLLKDYKPENIAIYGCSAGGLLSAMSVAWFQTHNLPRPGAIGVFCAGLAIRDIIDGGDANYVGYPLGEARLPWAIPAKGEPLFPEPSYLAGANPNDPLTSPRVSMDVLKKFPPTLFVTGTRAMEFSSAVYSREQLVKAGVDTDLHVWDGMFHGFWYNPDVPESREAYNVMVKFFDKHLGH